MLDNILGLRNIESEYQAILKGVIIVLAVVLQRQASRGSTKGDTHSNDRRIASINRPSKEQTLMRTIPRVRLLTIADGGDAGAWASDSRSRTVGTTEPVSDRGEQRRGSGTCIPEGGIEAKDSYLVGMSQANQGEPWRQAMNDQIAAAAEAHPELEVVFADAAQDNAQQVADVENFLSQGIDLLIISPNEAAPLTDVVASACAEGVPVIVLDRKVEGDQFTMWIGADNVLIGQEAGPTPPSSARSKVTIRVP